MKDINNRFIKKEPTASPTYTDFIKAAKEAGVENTFSKEDLRISIKDPGYGINLVNAKKNYNNAATEEEKQGWADYAQNERLKHGYYNEISGDGKGGYKVDAVTYDTLSGKQSETSRNVSDLVGLIKKYDESVGDKGNKWLTMIDKMFVGLVGDKFKYDAQSDPLYALSNEYANRAMKNQMAESAALSGGYGNSYAAAVGQQVYNDYMNEAVNALENKAYSRWEAERANKYKLLDFATQMENQDYNRKWNENEREYTRKWNEKARDYDHSLTEAEIRAELGDFSGYEELFGIDASTAKALYESGVDTKLLADAYSKFDITGDVSVFDGLDLSDEAISGIVAGRESKLFAEEFATAWDVFSKTKDPAKLVELGLDLSELYAAIKTEEGYKALEKAIYLANGTGDTSELKALGFNTSLLDKKWKKQSA